MRTYTVTPARYAHGMLAVSCPSSNGFKTRAARLCDHLKGRYSNRERAYILSPAKVERLNALFDAGRDASIFGELYPAIGVAS